MNRDLAREIVHRLRFSPAEKARRSTTFREPDWRHALGWLDESGLGLLYWNRLKEQGAESAVPAGIGEALGRNLADHRRRVAAMAQEFDALNRALERAGVRYAVLKGFALIPDYCADAALRPMYDYDYLVRPADAERAAQAFGAAGFVHRPGREAHPRVFVHSARPPRQATRRDELYAAAFPRTIELHHSLWEAEPLKIAVPLPADVLDSGESHTWQGLRFNVLAPEDALLFQLLHAFRHILRNWCRLSLLYDLGYFLEHPPSEAFWERFGARLKGREPMPEIAGVIASLAANLFGARVPAVLRAETIDKLPRSLALWVERYGPESALDNFLVNKFSLFLHREFVKDDAAWRGVRQKLLFPVQRPHRAVEAPSAKLADRLGAACRQALYGARRVVHHLGAALRYGWESYRWQRRRAGGR